MREVRIVCNVLENKAHIQEGEYLYKLLEEEPNFKMMEIEATAWLNNMIIMPSTKMKRIKIKYVKVNESDFLLIIQLFPNAVDEGYVEIGIVLSSTYKIISNTAYAVDMPMYPEITGVDLTLSIIPEWWHEMDLKDLIYLDEKQKQYDTTQKYKYVYIE